MEMGVMRGLITVLTLAVFLGICWWAYRPGNKTRFEADAMLPFDDDDAAADADENGGRHR
jgi:cytochrome c oxidase cbb3-type subunit 4